MMDLEFLWLVGDLLFTLGWIRNRGVCDDILWVILLLRHVCFSARLKAFAAVAAQADIIYGLAKGKIASPRFADGYGR